jgi:hypothetical protein
MGYRTEPQNLTNSLRERPATITMTSDLDGHIKRAKAPTRLTDIPHHSDTAFIKVHYRNLVQRLSEATWPYSQCSLLAKPERGQLVIGGKNGGNIEQNPLRQRGHKVPFNDRRHIRRDRIKEILNELRR